MVEAEGRACAKAKRPVLGKIQKPSLVVLGLAFGWGDRCARRGVRFGG